MSTKRIPQRPAKHDPGKWAEAQTREWLQARSDSDATFAFHRYPDTRSARLNIIGAQPADFLVSTLIGFDVFAVHLEVKETANPTRLPKTKLSQFGMLKKFDLAGFRSFVLIYRSASKDWCYLDRNDLFDHEDVPASFPFTHKLSYPTAAEALERIFS